MLEFHDVTVHFPRQPTPAVDHVSLKVERGDCYGILGQSGAGKSTLVRTINLLQVPTSGYVLLDGQKVDGSLSKGQLQQLRLKVGMIFQHFNLIRNATVFDNVAFNLKASGTERATIEAKVPKLLAAVGLTGKEQVYPPSLSGGQKQRVAIARALANDPEVLLCDEATSALDPDTTAEIVALLKQLKEERNLTVLFITHQMEVAKKLFNKVALMQHGKVVESGSTYDFFARPQSSYGQQLVAQYQHDLLPDELWTNEPELFEIIYKLDHAFDSVMAAAMHRFDVDINILGGRVEYIGGKPLGRLIISIARCPNPALKQEVLAFLAQSTYLTQLTNPQGVAPTAGRALQTAAEQAPVAADAAEV